MLSLASSTARHLEEIVEVRDGEVRGLSQIAGPEVPMRLAGIDLSHFVRVHQLGLAIL